MHQSVRASARAAYLEIHMAQKAVTRIASEVVGTRLSFTFPIEGAEPRVVAFDVTQLPQNIREYAIIHGIKQKLVDSMAIGAGMVDGKFYRPTIADKFKALMATAERLGNGVWNEVREGPVGGLLYQAMARLYPGKWESAAAFGEWLDGQADKRKVKRSVVEEGLRRSPKVAPIIEEIRAEMGKDTVDADDVLAELEDA
jgi:hypothetical protein